MKDVGQSKYKGILIDLDDTLCNSNFTFQEYGTKAAYDVLKEPLGLKNIGDFGVLLEQAKKEIKIELAGTASSHNRILYFKRIGEKVSNGLDPEILRKAYHEYWDATYRHLKLFPGVVETLEELKRRGMKLALVSDMTTEIQLEKIHHLGISKYFDAIVTSEEVGVEKPHPSMFHAALYRLQLLAKDVLMVGDNPAKDIEGGEALNMETVQIVTRDDRTVYKEGYFKPDHVIHRFSQIIEILDGEK